MQTPTFSFADGVLGVTMMQTEMRLSWRPAPRADELLPGRRRWQPFWPEYRLFRPVEPPKDGSQSDATESCYPSEDQALAHKAEVFAAFRNELPPDLVRIVEPFGSHQWALLVLLHEQPYAMDLAIQNPVLAYCLANNNEFRGTHVEAAAFQAISHSRGKQRAILEWLRFPGTEAMVRLTRKIPPESASPSILRRLRTAIRGDNRVMELLAHQPVIDLEVLELVTTLAFLDVVSPKLLLEVSTRDPETGGQSLADVIHGGVLLLKEIAPRRRIAPFTCVEAALRFRDDCDAEYVAHQERLTEAQERARVEMQRLRRRRDEADIARRRHEAEIAQRRHEAVVARRRDEAEVARRQHEVDVARMRDEAEVARMRHEAELARQRFPAPPVPGTGDIVPLTTAGELKAEGKEMLHCVGCYDSSVTCGSTYIYRVMAPERATLSIVRGEDGCWRRSELKGKANAKLRAGTVRAIDAWLNRYRVSI